MSPENDEVSYENLALIITLSKSIKELIIKFHHNHKAQHGSVGFIASRSLCANLAEMISDSSRKENAYNKKLEEELIDDSVKSIRAFLETARKIL